MQVKELKSLLQIPKLSDDLELAVVVKQSGSIGPSASVAVKYMSVGFDWDMGKILIYTEEPVAKSSFETAEKNCRVTRETWLVAL